MYIDIIVAFGVGMFFGAVIGFTATCVAIAGRTRRFKVKEPTINLDNTKQREAFEDLMDSIKKMNDVVEEGK